MITVRFLEAMPDYTRAGYVLDMAQTRGDRSTSSATSIAEDGSSVVLSGTGFLFSRNNATAGTVTTYQVFGPDGQLRFEITGLSLALSGIYNKLGFGSAFTPDSFAIETLISTGNKTVIGSSGGDSLNFGFGIGDDVVNAGDSFDFVLGDPGHDVINGGGGFDVLSYGQTFFGPASTTGSGITATGLAQQGSYTINDPWGGTDQAIDFDVIFGTNLGDTFVGAARTRDIFLGLTGNDLLNGGRGLGDRASYDRDVEYGGGGAVTVDLAAGTATDGFGDTDTLIDIEEVFATIFGDVIRGNASNNVFEGLTGADLMDGRGGIDTVSFDEEHLDYGGGALGNVTVNLRAGTATDRGGSLDTLISIENVIGGTGDDTIAGSNGANALDGFEGNDTLDGLGGADTLTGGEGSDAFRFSSALGPGNIDAVADFDAASDTILLSRRIFSEAGPAGELGGSRFKSVSAADLVDRSDRILYNTEDGTLAYDPDGSGGVAATVFAILVPGLSLTASHFDIY